HAINPTTTSSWSALLQHFKECKDVRLQTLFKEDPKRFDKFSTVWNDFLLDFSKNHVSEKTMQLLHSFADDMQLPDAIEKYFNGDDINETEGRAVSHTKLRDFNDMPQEVAATLQQMKQFSDEVIRGDYKGYSGKAITDVVNIGIGGSDLGPRMVTDA